MHSRPHTCRLLPLAGSILAAVLCAGCLTLVDAVEKRDFNMAKDLLDKGADPDTTDKNGQTVLAMCTHYQAWDSALALLDHGANPNVADLEGRPVLHHAVRDSLAWDQDKVLSKMLELETTNVNISDKMGETALHMLMRSKKDEADVIAARLMERGASLDAIDARGRTPLMAAVHAGQAGLVEAVENWQLPTADVLQILEELPPTRITAWKRVTPLLEQGANVNAFDKEGRTPLFVAAQLGDCDVVKGLLASGANPNARDLKKKSVLAAAQESLLIVRLKQLIETSTGLSDPDRQYLAGQVMAFEGQYACVVEALGAVGATP